MLEDELLKLKFKTGSLDALQRVYEKYRDCLLTLAMALVNDGGTAEDVVQDVFVAFAQSGSKFRLHGSLRACLATCAVNRVRDQMRARKRQGQALDDEIAPESDFDPAETRILSDERSRVVARALARLPEEQRETIALHLNGQLKLREIARLQEVPLTTVRGRYRHGNGRPIPSDAAVRLHPCGWPDLLHERD